VIQILMSVSVHYSQRCVMGYKLYVDTP